MSHVKVYNVYVPATFRVAKNIMNGLRRPMENRHRSLNDPKMGEKINPIKGPITHTSVACSRLTPYIKSTGDTNAVRMAYTISIPIIAKDNLDSSHFVFRLKKLGRCFVWSENSTYFVGFDNLFGNYLYM